MIRREKGFTIIEVLVTTIILTVGLMALASVQTGAVGTNYNSQRMTIATILAQDKIEELKNLAWNDNQIREVNANFTVDTNSDGVMDDFNWANPDHTNSDGVGGIANPIDQSGAHVSSGLATDGYTRVWCVADNTPTTHMKTLAVRVTWSDKSAHSVTVYTIISEN